VFALVDPDTNTKHQLFIKSRDPEAQDGASDEPYRGPNPNSAATAATGGAKSETTTAAAATAAAAAAAPTTTTTNNSSSNDMNTNTNANTNNVSGKNGSVKNAPAAAVTTGLPANNDSLALGAPPFGGAPGLGPPALPMGGPGIGGGALTPPASLSPPNNGILPGFSIQGASGLPLPPLGGEPLFASLGNMSISNGGLSAFPPDHPFHDLDSNPAPPGLGPNGLGVGGKPVSYPMFPQSRLELDVNSEDSGEMQRLL
jgi:hypothetical protein